jgi:hypothetical protein
MLTPMAKKKTYTAAPKVPPELQERYRAILEVLSGQTTVSEAARRLGMSRNHFQTILHRGLEGLIAGVTPAKAGRPSKPEREAQLEAERESLLRRTAQLERRLDMTTRIMGLASEVMRGSVPRSRTKRRPTETTSSADDEEALGMHLVARQLDGLGLPRALVARALSIPESTLRRLATTSPKPRPARAKSVSEQAIARAVEDIRELRGLVGAESLRHAHPELSRRQAARIKSETLTAMERERRAAAARVVVTEPGVVRGFDQLDFGHSATPRYALVAADAAVPFRTTTAAVERYDGTSVARVLAEDFERNGAPLVLRCDRAASHSTDEVRAVLAHYGVLTLQGPPRHPRFYGQTERQNRDHRMWLDAFDGDEDDLQTRLDRMRVALNERWRRPQLRFRTPSEAWTARTPIAIDRRALHANVAARARRLRESGHRDKISIDLTMRLAIEQELASLGYLRIEIRRPLLGDNGLVSSQS